MIDVGVFALQVRSLTQFFIQTQGAFSEHETAILKCSRADRPCSVFEIRTASDVDKADCIILPGGESTAMRIISQGTEERGGMSFSSI